ncbi:fibrobacter succinogenes major paralogous domain-containing protein [Bacteroidota bacterium]
MKRINQPGLIIILLLFFLLNACKKTDSPPSVPSNPYPADGAVDLAEYLTFSWVCSDPDNDILRYEVYLGIDSFPELVDDNNTLGFYNTPELEKGLQYYWKIIAIDEKNNSSESPLWRFSTEDVIIQTENVTDERDGKIYKAILLGNQWWTAENMNFIIDDISWCFTDNTGYCDKLGRLYNWEAAQNACPKGWHLPSENDWFILANFLGGWEVAGAKMKEEGTNNWQPPNKGATNSSTFTALPGGYRFSDGYFDFYGRYAYFWTSTLEDVNNAWARYVYYRQIELDHNYYSKSYGFSVRCIKD